MRWFRELGLSDTQVAKAMWFRELGLSDTQVAKAVIGFPGWVAASKIT